ncbi:MAG: hypothetical protein MPL62_16000, partial [Alphaproteobacteria bacterium]|nr:hypothetical protein [Alphaproteobacteria bacterium]
WYSVLMVAIEKSTGINQTEKVLGQLCDRVFLDAWNYLNPYRAKGKELCDLLAVFDGHIFIFQIKEIKFSDEEFDSDAGIKPAWERWKRKAFTAQLKSLEGAKNWILNNPKEIYLDAACQKPFPIDISGNGYKIHKILVAHGASEACKKFSDQNIVGSLGVNYGSNSSDFPRPTPFMLIMDKHDLVHVLDDHNLPIILGELDTAADFTQYLVTKERAIQKFNVTIYCGEEDLLAAYIAKHPFLTKIHDIDAGEEKPTLLFIREGEWEKFRACPEYKHKKAADEISYLWDRLLQWAYKFALAGTATGDDNLFGGHSAIYEMAKEPRFWRRCLAKEMMKSLQKQKNSAGEQQHACLCKSYYADTAYVFMWEDRPSGMNYDEYRRWRLERLEIACGVARNLHPQFTKIVGITYLLSDKEKIVLGEFSLLDCSFILLDSEEWTEENRALYEKANEDAGFFRTAYGKKSAVNSRASKLRRFLASLSQCRRGRR